jgi:hypothetical protein
LTCCIAKAPRIEELEHIIGSHYAPRAGKELR